MFCTNCQGICKEGDMFCSNCGAKIQNDLNHNVNSIETRNNSAKYGILVKILVIIAIIMTLITAVSYNLGFRPVLVRDSRSDYSTKIMTTHVWSTNQYLEELEDLEYFFSDDANQVYNLMSDSLDIQVKTAIVYFVYSAFLVLLAFFIYSKSKFTNIAGLFVVFIGFLVLFGDYGDSKSIIYDDGYMEYTALPQVSTLFLFAIFLIMFLCFVAHLLETFIQRQLSKKIAIETNNKPKTSILFCIFLSVCMFLCLLISIKYFTGNHAVTYSMSSFYFESMKIDSISEYLNMDMVDRNIHNSVYLYNSNGPFAFFDFSYENALFHWCVTFAYVTLFVLLLLTLIFTLKKAKIVKIFSIITGIYGVIMVASECLIGIFFMKHNYNSVSLRPDYYESFAPDYGTLLLIPFVITIVILAFLLPKSKKLR